MPSRSNQPPTCLPRPPAHGVWVWCGGRKDAADRQFLESEDIGLIIAGVGHDTDDFEYGATVKHGVHRLPIQFAGKEKGAPMKDAPLRDRTSHNV